MSKYENRRRVTERSKGESAHPAPAPPATIGAAEPGHDRLQEGGRGLGSSATLTALVRILARQAAAEAIGAAAAREAALKPEMAPCRRRLRRIQLDCSQ
jgi:hypothetical protein